MALDPVQQSMVTAAVHAARDRVDEDMPGVRSGVVISVDPTNTTALVNTSGPGMDPHPAEVVCPVTLYPGDRVKVLFLPPHGAVVLGRRSGDWDYWHVVGDEGEPDFDGGKGVRWDSAVSTVYPGQDGYSVVTFTRRSGRVELRGHAARVSGSDDDIFALPQDYWPENDLLLAASTGLGAYTPVFIESTSGMVRTAAGVNSVLLDGVSFLARPTNPD